MRRILGVAGALALGVAALPPIGRAGAQQTCRPPMPPASTQPNIFSETQENDFGDAVAEQLERDLRIIDDAALNGDLRRIGDRLVRHLPATSLKIQFFLIDWPDANAFVLPGGRIYVSRKLVSFSQSEDELAGVLGHELGHLVLRQQTIAFTRLLREVLNVTALGDRKDVFDKYHALMDNAARRPGAFRRSGSHEDRDQVDADRLGIFVVGAAGYDPQAHVRLFDRLMETKGNTGNFFSNLFGTTAPESRRLREMIRTADAVPPACVDARTETAGAYQRWQAYVVAYTGLGRTESLHHVVSRTVLEPPLRGEVTHIRFSPDGRSLLAQDDAGITVLSREPFRPRFRIEAPEAMPATFTPDSTQVVFRTLDLRVERWGIADGRLVDARELVIRGSCTQTELSPDGRTLACLDDNFDLVLLDMASSSVVFRKKEFYTPDFLTLMGKYVDWSLSSGEAEFLSMGFSTDGRFFAASFLSRGIPELMIGRDDDALVYDLQAKAPVSIGRGVKNIMMGGFVFTGPDRLIAFNANNSSKSAVIGLPSGTVVQQLGMFPGRLEAATRGNYLFVRPFQKYAVGVMDVAKGQVVKGSPNVAIDLYDDVFVAERLNGELAIYGIAENTPRATVTLPRNTLGRLRAATVSSDLKYLAVSERSRGALWDLERGERLLHIRGFRGGFFDNDQAFFADLPKSGQEPRRIIRLDPKARRGEGLGEIKDESAEQSGPFLFVTTPLDKDRSRQGVTLEMRQIRDPRVLWTKTFTKDAPSTFLEPTGNTAVLMWPAGAATVRDETRKDAALSKNLSALKEKEGDYFLQVLDAATGTARGALFLETGKGSFDVDDVFVAKDWVVIADSQNRVLVYALSTGAQAGHVFGSRVSIGAAAGLLCVENGPGRLRLYDLATLRLRDEFTFAHAVSMSAFTPDGRRLLVLTADQVAYVLDVSGATGARFARPSAPAPRGRPSG